MAVVLFHQKMVAILNFRSFCKTQKCLYLENCARWSEFNNIFDLLDISAEYPCQFSKYFCLAKYSGHFEFFAKIAKHKNAYILKTMLDRADCADFGCHNSIRLETEHFLNTLALTFISFSGRFVFAMQIIFFFCERSSSLFIFCYKLSGRRRKFEFYILAHPFPFLSGIHTHVPKCSDRFHSNRFKYNYLLGMF